MFEFTRNFYVSHGGESGSTRVYPDPSALVYYINGQPASETSPEPEHDPEPIEPELL